MKHLRSIALLLLATTPAWPAARKISVAELKDMLLSLHRENKSDSEVADALRQIQLTEELTRSMMNSLVSAVPGQLSTEQIYVLEARSAMLAPPPSDIPTTPAPDAAAQQAILAKADTFATKTFPATPAVTLTRATLRFQDNVTSVAASSSMHSNASDVPAGSGPVSPNQFVRYINASETAITIDRGEEKLPEDKTRWGGNGMIALMTPDPGLAQVWADAKDSGSVKWLRWELINAKPAAVFSFQVPRKKAHLALNVCCFPELDQAGSARFPSNGMGGGMGSSGEGDGRGTFQTSANFSPFKNVPPYHGEFFIDSDTGVVVRMITEAELKSSDVVHQVDTRIDYAPVTVGGRSLILPTKTVVDTEVVPYGDSGAGGYHTRTTLFTSEYKNQQLAGAAAQK